jgi:hypothetical protein
LGSRIVSIHSRRPRQEVLDWLAQHTTPARVLPILHWFSDALSTAKLAAERGCYFSVNHRTLEGESGLTLIRAVPADRLLTETDAPFTEFDGRHSEPRDVMATAKALARVRGMPAAQMADSLRANAARVLAFRRSRAVIRGIAPQVSLEVENNSRTHTPKHDGEPASTTHQKAGPAVKKGNPPKSAKPPSPVQIRAAPPFSRENSTIPPLGGRAARLQLFSNVLELGGRRTRRCA